MQADNHFTHFVATSFTLSIIVPMYHEESAPGSIFNEVKKNSIYVVGGLWGFEDERALRVEDR